MKYNDTFFNILASFAYLGKNKNFYEMIIKSSKDNTINLMIDSGAFTLFNAKGKGWLTLDTYCEFMEKNERHCCKYAMLDVIGNEKESKINYEEMLRRGFNPMYVLTMFDNDYGYLRDAVKNQKDLCVAGGVTSKGGWMKKRFQDVYKNTKADIHGLGYVSFPDMLRLPLKSVDSSSWVQGPAVYGGIQYFNNKLKSIRYIDILKKQKNIPIKLKFILERYKITPKMFSNLNNHRGKRSIGNFLSCIAHNEYQKYCKKNGLDLYLAVVVTWQLENLLYVYKNIDNGLTYQKFKTNDFKKVY